MVLSQIYLSMTTKDRLDYPTSLIQKNKTDSMNIESVHRRNKRGSSNHLFVIKTAYKLESLILIDFQIINI